MSDPANFSKTLITWYLNHKRRLPWRETNNPYHIWISEIILQQTRVNQGLGFYQRFIERFPDIQTLAEATEEDVLKLWEGLGYYSRARNMHFTARFLVNNCNGEFPRDAEKLEKLKGIGKYTAAAIASIAFNKPAAVVDGNVLRFLARYAGIENPIDNRDTVNAISNLAKSLMGGSNPGMFNQAMMEFGALQCVPQKPDCNSCCFVTHCKAFRIGKVGSLPLKTMKPKPLSRFFNYLVIQLDQTDGAHLVLKRRNNHDIWKHLYDFPLIEATELFDLKHVSNHPDVRSMFINCEPVAGVFEGVYRHQLTHRIIHAKFFKLNIPDASCLLDQSNLIITSDLSRYPLPRMISRFVSENFVATLIKPEA